MASPVALEELLVSSLAQTDTLAKLLIEKSVINYAQSTRQCVVGVLKNVRNVACWVTVRLHHLPPE